MTVNVTLCPAFRVKGKVTPLTENTLPMVCIPEIVTPLDRAFVSTRGKLELLPTATCPNERVEGLAVTVSLITPVPPACTARIELEASLVKSIVPGIHPVVGGVKLILTSTL